MFTLQYHEKNDNIYVVGVFFVSPMITEIKNILVYSIVIYLKYKTLCKYVTLRN